MLYCLKTELNTNLEILERNANNLSCLLPHTNITLYIWGSVLVDVNLVQIMVAEASGGQWNRALPHTILAD